MQNHKQTSPTQAAGTIYVSDKELTRVHAAMPNNAGQYIQYPPMFQIPQQLGPLCFR